MVVVRIVGITGAPASLADPACRALHQKHAGRYLASYDNRTPAGALPRITTTETLAAAHHFESVEAATETLYAPYGWRPWDGEPNRPITAFDLELFDPTERNP